MTRRLPALLILGALALAACGSDDEAATDTTAAAQDATTVADPATTAAVEAETTAPATTEPPTEDSEVAADGASTTYPLTIDNCGVELTFDAPPERVVLLNGTSVAEVESFLALGIEGRIVANSQSYGVSDVDGVTERIAALPTGGVTLNENFEVPREQTLAQDPDLVVSTWAGGFSEEMGSVTREQLAELGINSYVTPVNCSYGALDPRPEDQEKGDNQTYEASFELLQELGVIFDVQATADQVIADARASIEAATAEVPASDDPPSVLVAYPGMSMMNANGLPAVFGGSFYDSIIEAAGGVNAFPDRDFADMGNVNAEEMAAADVDVLVIGLFMEGEDPAAYAEQIFAQFPEWSASKSKTFTSLAETFYLGPFNAVAIEKIADAIATLG